MGLTRTCDRCEEPTAGGQTVTVIVIGTNSEASIGDYHGDCAMDLTVERIWVSGRRQSARPVAAYLKEDNRP